MPNPHRPILKTARLVVLLAAALLAISSIAGIAVAAFALQAVLWSTLGFTLITLVSACLGIAVGIGRFDRGIGMATLCIGGSVAVATGFTMIDLRPNLGTTPILARMLMPWVGVQSIAALAIVAAGSIEVLSRRAASWGHIAKGAAFLVPAGAITAGAFVGMRMVPANETGQVLSLAILLVGGLVIGTLVSLGGHHLIRAFEVAADNEPSPKKGG